MEDVCGKEKVSTSDNADQFRNHQESGDVIVLGDNNHSPKTGDEVEQIPFSGSKMSSHNLEQLWGEAEFVPSPKDSVSVQGDTPTLQHSRPESRQFDLGSSQVGARDEEEDCAGQTLMTSFENVDTVKKGTSDAVPAETEIQVSLHNGSSLQLNLASPGDFDELLELAKKALKGKIGGEDHETKVGRVVVEEAVNVPKVGSETVIQSSPTFTNQPVKPSSPVRKGFGQAKDKMEVKPKPARVDVALVEERPKQKEAGDKKLVRGSTEPVKSSPMGTVRQFGQRIFNRLTAPLQMGSRRYQPKRANVRKQGLKLSELLKSEVGIDGFTDFCNHEHNDENIRFFLECIEYSSLHHEDDRKEKAEIMVQDFIVNTADYQVNLDHGTYVRIMKKHKRGEAGPDLFKEAQHSVFKLMRTDSFSRFKKTSQYVELCLAIMDPTGELGVMVTSASVGQSCISEYQSSSIASDAESSGAIPMDRGNVPMNNSGGSVSPTTSRNVASPLSRFGGGLRRLLHPEMCKGSRGVVYPTAEM